MIYMSVGNWISVIGFSICIVYCVILLVLGFIKRIKAKKQIKLEEQKKKQKVVSKNENKETDNQAKN